MTSPKTNTPSLSQIEERERMLQVRLQQLETLEQELLEKENAVKAREAAKKSILLRLPSSLHAQIAAWAEEDFRSINGQIEYLLTEAVKQKYKK